MDLDIDYAAVQQEFATARTFDALEVAMAKIEQLTTTIAAPETFGRKLFAPGLDALVPTVAKSLRLEDIPSAKSSDNVCIVATQFYMTGGHTSVARDLVKGLGPQNSPTVVLTNTWGGHAKYRGLMNGGTLRSFLEERAFLILSAPSRVEKAVELYLMLKAIRPSRIVLICHPFDIVANLAVWPFRDIVDFVHHCDHVPALGASLPWSSHADLTYTCHRACRASGLDAVYAGMTSPVTEAPVHRREPERLRFATCGDQRKYDAAGRHRWIDFAIAAMRQPGAEMVHIGPMSEDFQASVLGALAAEGLDPSRYAFVGRAESLPQALIDHQTDIYLSSYPAGGGKANLEAMLVGLPLIVPIAEDMAPLLRFDIPLPGYVVIESPDQFADAVPRALALGEAMGEPEQRALREREVGRFADFVARRPIAAA